MKLKKINYLLIVILMIFSLGCEKEDEKLYSEIGDDIIFTDSFSPADWENPVARKPVVSGDKDIGVFIDEDVIDPKLRNILSTINSFISIIRTENDSGLDKILTPAAFNSFELRNKELVFRDKYQLRIENPTNLYTDVFWIKFKLLFSQKSFVGSVELEFKDEQCLISDFENAVFKEVVEFFSKGSDN